MLLRNRNVEDRIIKYLEKKGSVKEIMIKEIGIRPAILGFLLVLIFPDLSLWRIVLLVLILESLDRPKLKKEKMTVDDTNQ